MRCGVSASLSFRIAIFEHDAHTCTHSRTPQLCNVVCLLRLSRIAIFEHDAHTCTHSRTTLTKALSTCPNNSQVFLHGNPLIFLSCLLVIPAYVVLGVVFAFRRQRAYMDFDSGGGRRFLSIAHLMIGWFLHWAPFFLMERQVCILLRSLPYPQISASCADLPFKGTTHEQQAQNHTHMNTHRHIYRVVSSRNTQHIAHFETPLPPPPRARLPVLTQRAYTHTLSLTHTHSHTQTHTPTVQLFFHHYMPAHYFLILAFSAFFDLLARKYLPAPAQWALVAGLSLAYFYVFLLYSPIAFGMPGLDRTYVEQKLLWSKRWKIL